MKNIKKYENVEEFKKLNDGEKTLVHAMYNSKAKMNLLNDDDIVLIDDIVWGKDYEDFKKALDKFDINKIIFASTWSSAIELLMFLLENGFKVAGTVNYNKDVWLTRVDISKGIKLIRG